MRILMISFWLMVGNYASPIFAQTQTTESKSCGACGKAVSNNSTAGMKCPHCGVTWGSENTSTNYTQKYTTYSSGNSSSKSTKFVAGFMYFSTSNVKLRPDPSTANKEILTIPAYNHVTVLEILDEWLYVKYNVINGMNTKTYYGYVFKELY